MEVSDMDNDHQWDEVFVDVPSTLIAEQNVFPRHEIMTIQANPPNYLRLGLCGISIDLQTGEVSIPTNLTMSEAAQAFWEAVQRMTGQRCGFD
jgi:hypothetical protein